MLRTKHHIARRLAVLGLCFAMVGSVYSVPDVSAQSMQDAAAASALAGALRSGAGGQADTAISPELQYWRDRSGALESQLENNKRFNAQLRKRWSQMVKFIRKQIKNSTDGRFEAIQRELDAASKTDPKLFVMEEEISGQIAEVHREAKAFADVERKFTSMPDQLLRMIPGGGMISNILNNPLVQGTGTGLLSFGALSLFQRMRRRATQGVAGVANTVAAYGQDAAAAAAAAAAHAANVAGVASPDLSEQTVGNTVSGNGSGTGNSSRNRAQGRVVGESQRMKQARSQ